MSSLVEHYLDSSSSQAVVLLSSIREPHHKVVPVSHTHTHTRQTDAHNPHPCRSCWRS